MLLETGNPETAWLVVHAKPLRERVAEAGLRDHGFPVYCPRVLQPPSHIRASRGPVPLFPRYLFCFATLTVAAEATRYCPGVSGLVRFGDRVAAIEPNEIDLLRTREGSRGYLVIPKKPLVTGNRVRIMSGPMRGFEAIVDGSVASSDRVRLLLAVASGTWRLIVPTSSAKRIEG